MSDLKYLERFNHDHHDTAYDKAIWEARRDKRIAAIKGFFRKA